MHQLPHSLHATSILCGRIVLRGNIWEVVPLRYWHVKRVLLTHAYVPNWGIDLLQNRTPGQTNSNQLVYNPQNTVSLIVFICSVSRWYVGTVQASWVLLYSSLCTVLSDSVVHCWGLEPLDKYRRLLKVILQWVFAQFSNFLPVERARHDYIDEFLQRLVYSSWDWFNVRSLFCQDGSSPQALWALKHKTASHFAADTKPPGFILHLEQKLFGVLHIMGSQPFFKDVYQITVPNYLNLV